MWVERERSGKRSGAGRKSGAKKRSGRGRKRWSVSGRRRSGNGTGSGLNRPLTARYNLTFYWLHNVYSSHSTVWRLLFRSSRFLSSCTSLATCSNLAQPFSECSDVRQLALAWGHKMSAWALRVVALALRPWLWVLGLDQWPHRSHCKTTVYCLLRNGSQII